MIMTKFKVYKNCCDILLNYLSYSKTLISWRTYCWAKAKQNYSSIKIFFKIKTLKIIRN